ncbi:MULTISPECIES: DUF5805 domain-containing protein [Halococcus]|uniref:Uncharacterized protein n=1 Tax=Halococcus salifodinae DSM 8989 TaxID=1227456 RepID=M0N5R5_9EURY|nr:MULTISPECIES: DUF5805 domain-containing protein [Halococcus]EMA53272.1 hypothetical protein C450_08157 [Halococcus salifodinae DSM 8989]
MTDGADTDRKEVRVSVSAHQKARWREHADELGMNQSEFVRTMTQAGRRGFTVSPDEAERTDSEDETPGVDGLEDRVFDVLDDDYCSWDELVEALTEDIEGRLETTLQRLQRENRVEYSGRHGGYSLTNTDGD